MTKKDVQKRVLHRGKQIKLSDFVWDEKTNTFSSELNNLVVDFSDISDCTFSTGSHCTFKTGYNCTFTTSSQCTFKTGYNCTFTTGSHCTFTTGSHCTFTTGSQCTFTTSYNCTFKTGYNCTFTTGSQCTFTTSYNCTFKTGYNCTFTTGSHCTFTTGSDCTFTTGYNCTFTTSSQCTFKTGYNCTFSTSSDCTFSTGSHCVIVRRDIFEVLTLTKNTNNIILCPYKVKGYLEPIDGKYYMNGNVENGEYIIVDKILSKVISKKINILKVINHGETQESFIIQDGDIFSHGKTLQEAKDSLIYKISNRDTSQYENLIVNLLLMKS